MFRRILCIALCAMLCVGLLPALAEETERAADFVMAGYDGEDSSHDWNTNKFFTRMEERTGIKFEFKQYTKYTDWQKDKAALLEGDNKPDVLFKAALTTEEMIRYTDGGQLIDLAPLLEENAPNLWKLLQENPEWLKAITLPNGKIGALPAIQRNAAQNILWINQDWLNNLGLKMPTDWQSLTDVLTAFRDNDPNGNHKRDEVPMVFLGPWELKFFSHAFGVVANDFNIYLDDAGTVHYWPNEDSFFELAKALRVWFEEGLLDQDGFITADSMRRVTDTKATITYGVMFSPTPANLLPYEAAMKYTVLQPLTFGGKQIYRDLSGSVVRGTFAITSACKDPAALLRWVDVLYTEEGAIEALAGKQDEDYEVDEDGYWQWAGGMDEMSMDKMNELSLYDTGNMPWYFPDAFYMQYADDGVRRLSEETYHFNELTVQPFPTYTLTAEQNDRVTALQAKLGPYVDSALARFVLGEEPVNDETIAAFRAGLAENGMDDMISFWQSVADEQK